MAITIQDIERLMQEMWDRPYTVSPILHHPKCLDKNGGRHLCPLPRMSPRLLKSEGR